MRIRVRKRKSRSSNESEEASVGAAEPPAKQQQRESPVVVRKLNIAEEAYEVECNGASEKKLKNLRDPHEKRPRTNSINTAAPPEEKQQSWEVGLFWDYENVRIPKGFDTVTVSNLLREKLVHYGQLCTKRLYYDSRKRSEAGTDRMGLDNSGFTVVDCPTRNQKEVVDKKIIVDVMSFAWARVSKQVPACVALISSDGDYSYMLNKLRDMRVHVVVIYGPSASPMLLKSSDRCLRWQHDVLRCCGGPNPTNGKSSSTGTVSASIPTAQSAEEHTMYTAEDGKFMTLLVVIEEAQKWQAWKEGSSNWASCWANSGVMCQDFYKKDGLIELDKEERRACYLALRDDAIAKGLVQVKKKAGNDVYVRLASAGAEVDEDEDEDEEEEEEEEQRRKRRKRKRGSGVSLSKEKKRSRIGNRKKKRAKVRGGRNRNKEGKAKAKELRKKARKTKARVKEERKKARRAKAMATGNKKSQGRKPAAFPPSAEELASVRFVPAVVASAM